MDVLMVGRFEPCPGKISPLHATAWGGGLSHCAAPHRPAPAVIVRGARQERKGRVGWKRAVLCTGWLSLYNRMPEAGGPASEMPFRRRKMRRPVRAGLIILGLLSLGALPLTVGAQGKGKPVEPIPHEKLASFLKDFKGWEAAGPADARTMRTPNGAYSLASRSYDKEEKTLDVTVIDTALVPMAYMEYDDMKQDVGKGPNPVKETKVAGHEALESFDPGDEESTATLMVKVKDRLIVIFEFYAATPKDDLKAIASQLDWKGLEALVSSGK